MPNRNCLLIPLITLALSAQAQEMWYSRALSTGDPIQVPGIGEEWSVAGISRIEWSGEYLGIFSADASSRSFLSFWYPGAVRAELSAGTGWPFPEFEADPGTTNRDGDPPGSPFITSAFGVNAYDGSFLLKTSVSDFDTTRVESWPAVFSAGYETGLQHWYHGYLTPVIATPQGDAVYVGDIDLEAKQGWLLQDGTVQTLVDQTDSEALKPPIPTGLNDATKVFWGGIVEVLDDRTTVHFSSYNTSTFGVSGNIIYATDPSGAVKVLVDTRGTIPTHENIPAGADTLTLGDVSVSEAGRILYYAGISKQGEFNRKTYWSTDTLGGTQYLELSTFVEYTQFDGSKVSFDNLSKAIVDDAGFILFQARVEGEKHESVWRAGGPADVTRVSPLPGSKLPGFPDYEVRKTRIAAMNSTGRAALRIEGFGNNEIIDFYYLEREDLSLIHIATNGRPLGDIDEPVSITDVVISEQAEIGLLVSRREGFAYNHYVVVARDPADVQASGTTYRWDGGAGTNNWHTVVNGRSNWVDASGVPWDAPPNSAIADVTIDVDTVVQLDESFVRFRQLNLAQGSLEVGIPVTCELAIFVQDDASLVLQGSELEAPLIASTGVIIKEQDRTFFLLSEDLRIENSELIVEDGTFNLWSTTTLDNATLRVEGGTVDLAGVTTFKGDAPRIEVQDTALLRLTEPKLTFESNLSIHTQAGGKIEFGQKTNQVAAAFVFSTEFPEERRILDFTGEGQITFFTPFTVSEQGIIKNNSGTGSIPGVLIDTEIEQAGKERPIVNGLFENHAGLEIVSGGISGEFRNYGTLLITNNISLDPPVLLDCENEGTIIQDGAFHYQNFVAKPGSLHRLLTTPAAYSDIAPDIQGTPTLLFEKGSVVEAIGTRCSIEFTKHDTPNLLANIEVFEDAELTIQKANTGPAKIIDIKSKGLLKMEDITFEKLTLKGAGASVISGTVKPNSDEARFRIGTKTFSIEDATFEGLEVDEIATPTHETALYQIAPIGAFEQFGSIKDTMFAARSFVHASLDTDLYFETGITLNDTFRFEGECYLTAPILAGTDPDGIGKLWAGYYLSGKGDLVVAPNITETVTIPYLHIGGNQVNITIQESTHVMINFYSFINGGDTLSAGNWTIHDFAACELKQFGTEPTRINEIAKGASLKIGRPHATVPSFGLILDQQENFAVAGKFDFSHCTLSMNGHTLYSNNNVVFGPGSEVIGNVESIRGDVQGVIQLAGNIDIQGNLTMDTTLSLGASPGTGKISGNLTLLPGANMIVEVGGNEPGTGFDFLEVDGVTSLDGTLQVSLIDGYIPEVDENFLFLRSATLSGSFANVDQTEMGRLRRFELNTEPEGLSLTATAIQISSYADWRSFLFNASDAADDSISGLTADPDHDGLTNLSEYLHATLPQRTSPPPFTFDLSTPSTLIADVQWAKNVTDFDWTLQFSTNLETWTPLTFTSELQGEADDKEFFQVEADLVGSSSEKRFYRFAARPATP